MELLFLGPMLRVSAVCIVLWLAGCNSAFYQPNSRVYVEPERLKIRYTDHTLITESGTKLHGRVFHRGGEGPSRGLFVLFHGNAQNLTAHFLQFAWVLSRGYDLFVFDYPGYGSSEGAATRGSTLEAGAAALDFVSTRLLPAETGRLILVGESLGGALLLRAFPDWKDRRRATLVVAECTFLSYRSEARWVLSRHWLTWAFQPLVPLLVTEEGSPRGHVARISPTPLLVAACQEDRVMNPAFARDIFERAGRPKRLWELPGCGHIQAFQTRENRERLMGLIDSLGIPSGA